MGCRALLLTGVIVVLAASAPARSAVAPPEATVEAATKPIVVKASSRPWWDDDQREPEVIVPTGSHIPRLVTPIFPTLASFTGGPGFIRNGSDGWDMLAGGVIRRPVRKCRVPGTTISHFAACQLADIKQAMESQNLSLARTRALKMEGQSFLNEEERYAVQGYLFNIAAASGDGALKERVLTKLVDGGHLPAADRIAAVGTLAAMRYEAGDREGALRYYQSLATIEPANEQTQANIAALYQRGGQYAEAKLAIRKAVQLAQNNGHAIPVAWQDNAR